MHGLRWAPRSSKPLLGILGDVEGRIVPVAPPPIFLFGALGRIVHQLLTPVCQPSSSLQLYCRPPCWRSPTRLHQRRRRPGSAAWAIRWFLAMTSERCLCRRSCSCGLHTTGTSNRDIGLCVVGFHALGSVLVAKGVDHLDTGSNPLAPLALRLLVKNARWKAGRRWSSKARNQSGFRIPHRPGVTFEPTDTKRGSDAGKVALAQRTPVWRLTRLSRRCSCGGYWGVCASVQRNWAQACSAKCG